MGQKDTFDMSYVCTEANAGGKVAGKVPVLVAYVAAFYAKRHFGRCDCNVTTCGSNNDLCHYGAADIQQNLTSIINVYKSYAQGFASCYGTTKPIVFEMEPDWYQYTYTSQQTMALTEAQAGTIMGQFVDAIRQLPNAVFSLDISPWVGSNGSDNGKEWYSHFDMTKFTFINTSGGSTDATYTKIRSTQQHDLGRRQPGDRQADPGRHRATASTALGRSDANWDRGQHQRSYGGRGRRDYQYNPARPGATPSPTFVPSSTHRRPAPERFKAARASYARPVARLCSAIQEAGASD